MHSFTARGATAAANNGVSDRLFKQHGRWKSETAKDVYVFDSEEVRLQVSQPGHLVSDSALLCYPSVVFWLYSDQLSGLWP